MLHFWKKKNSITCYSFLKKRQHYVLCYTFKKKLSIMCCTFISSSSPSDLLPSLFRNFNSMIGRVCLPNLISSSDCQRRKHLVEKWALREWSTEALLQSWQYSGTNTAPCRIVYAPICTLTMHTKVEQMVYIVILGRRELQLNRSPVLFCGVSTT